MNWSSAHSKAGAFRNLFRLEGHPDNAAPAAYGGFNIVREGQRQAFHSLGTIVFCPPDSEFRDRHKTSASCAAVPRRSLGTPWKTAGTHAPSPPHLPRANTKNFKAPFVDYLHNPSARK